MSKLIEINPNETFNKNGPFKYELKGRIAPERALVKAVLQHCRSCVNIHGIICCIFYTCEFDQPLIASLLDFTILLDLDWIHYWI